MISKAKTVKEYLASLPDDRRAALEAVRTEILKNLDADYEEGMQYGMIGYYVPHRVYPDGYHCDPKQPLPFAGIASQKNNLAIYMMCLYGDPKMLAWFQKEWAKTGKKLDMGKSCIRFKKLDDVPLEVIGEAIARVPAKDFIASYESTFKTMGKRTSSAAKKPARAKPSSSAGNTATARKAVPRKSAKKKASKKAARKKAAKRAS